MVGLMMTGEEPGVGSPWYQRAVAALEADQVGAAPGADTVDAACWRYFLENHRLQIAAAFNCSEYEIADRLRDCVPEARPAWMKS